MKRFLYLLIAAAVSGGAPAFSVDSMDAATEVDEDAPGLVDTSSEVRRGPGTVANDAMVVVQPWDPGRATPRWKDVRASLVVDRSVRDTAVIRTRGDAGRGASSRLARLLAKALRDAWDHGDLKVVIESPIPLPELTRLCTDTRFVYERTVEHGGRQAHEFLADLYTLRADEAGDTPSPA